ncbi:hypothetical protein E2542_SST28661 [Spatholobus suberectus]|nr:hypothetical protein E2542_SST28661 [Spatholobus suberectus]
MGGDACITLFARTSQRASAQVVRVEAGTAECGEMLGSNYKSKFVKFGSDDSIETYHKWNNQRDNGNEMDKRDATNGTNWKSGTFTADKYYMPTTSATNCIH